MARALVLLSLTLLPVQMRAGAIEAHPHSLLQLLVDATDDGRIDHHSPVDQLAHAHASSHQRTTLCAHDPDIPSLEESGRAAGGTITLAALAAALPLPGAGTSPIWHALMPGNGLLLTPDPPPPRPSLA